MGKLFGTDGVRGVAGTELDCTLAFAVGKAGAIVLTSHKNGTKAPTILIGKDTRISGDMLEAALIAGICSAGANVVKLGVVPTPAVAYLTRKYEADAGVVISASHNSMEYNGIKFFNFEGFKLPDDVEDEIEDLILNNKLKNPEYEKTGAEIGRVTECETAIFDYVAFAKSTVNSPLTGLKLAVDCANGATYKTSLMTLSELGAELTILSDRPDGININDNCGSTHLENLKKAVVENKCDAGVAFDGDGDRMLAVDEKGNVVDGDQIMAICAKDMLEKGELTGKTVVATVMSNLGLTIAAKENGFNIKQTAVGDRYVLEQMRQTGEVLGGEQSGHVIFLNHNTTGDGLVSALKLLEILKKSGKTLSELAGIMKVLPQVMVNATVPNNKKEAFHAHEGIKKEIEKLETALLGEGRVLIRPSGTEPLVRVMLEGKDIEFLEKEARRLADYITKELA